MLHEEYILSTEIIDQFQRDGHTYLPHVFPLPNLIPYKESIEKLAESFRANQKPIHERDTYGKAFLQMMNLWEEDQQVKELVFAKRFAGIAAKLLGVERVRLYHDQALFKEPGGGHTPWHQDQYYWPIASPKTVTMWMPLVDIESGMGMLTFASGSQNVTLPPMQISDTSESLISAFVSTNQFEISAQESMHAGDATFHLGWTLHSAPGNLSGSMREVMTIIYIDADALIAEPTNTNQEADRQRWLSGGTIGELANGPLNPILY